MIKIAQIYRAANGTQEAFELTFSAAELSVPEIQGPAVVRGNFLRVQEGIMMLIQEIKASQISSCSRCAKKLKIPLVMARHCHYSACPVFCYDIVPYPQRRGLIVHGIYNKPACKYAFLILRLFCLRYLLAIYQCH